jgi:general secretion pathway protein N
MRGWHPATRMLLGVGVIALPYLAWTSLAETPVPVVDAVASSAGPPAGAPQPQTDEPQIQRLPAVETFSAMIERPLFSASRRPAPKPAAGAGPTEPGAGPDGLTAGTQGTGQPAIRFVGTVGRDGAMTAVVIRTAKGDAIQLAAGDVIDGWEVGTVTSSELTLLHEEERLVMTILQ